jgi:hypothetical protein
MIAEIDLQHRALRDDLDMKASGVDLRPAMESDLGRMRVGGE